MPEQQQRPNFLKMLNAKSFDLFDDMNFSAENMILTDESISSIQIGNATNLKASFSAGALIGVQPYKAYVALVFSKQILIYEGSTLRKTITKSPDYTFVDFTLFYRYLLVFEATGKFFWIDMESPTTSSGYNTSLYSDVNFLPTSQTIVSCCNHLGFLVFSRSDNMLVWTKALVVPVPSAWAYWISGGSGESDRLSYAQNTYYLGEPVRLGSYNYIIGIGYNSYVMSFVQVGDYVSLAVQKQDLAFGQTKDVMFCDDTIWVVDDVNVKIYSPTTTATYTRAFQGDSFNFTNFTVTLPCLRCPQPTLQMTSAKYAAPAYFMAMRTHSKMFYSGFVFNSGIYYYIFTPVSDNVYDIDYFIMGLSESTVGPWVTPTPRTIDYMGLDEVMRTFLTTYAVVGSASMQFRWQGVLVAFKFDVEPTKMVVNKDSSTFGQHFYETATIRESSYPYAMFRSRGNIEEFSFVIDGDFVIADLVIQ